MNSYSVWHGRPTFKAELGDRCKVVSTGEVYTYTKEGWITEALIKSTPIVVPSPYAPSPADELSEALYASAASTAPTPTVEEPSVKVTRPKSSKKTRSTSK